VRLARGEDYGRVNNRPPFSFLACRARAARSRSPRQRSVTDLPTLVVALVTVAAIWKIKKLPEPVIAALAAAIGLLVYESSEL
jgi:hypothetical protein